MLIVNSSLKHFPLKSNAISQKTIAHIYFGRLFLRLRLFLTRIIKSTVVFSFLKKIYFIEFCHF